MLGAGQGPGVSLPHGAEWKRRRALWRAARERQIKGKADSEEGAPRSSQEVQVERAKPGPRTSPLSLQTPRRLPRMLVRQEHHSSSRPHTAHRQSLAPVLRQTTTKASTWPALQVEPGSLGVTIPRPHPSLLDCQAQSWPESPPQAIHPSPAPTLQRTPALVTCLLSLRLACPLPLSQG